MLFFHIQLLQPATDDEKAGRLPWRVMPEVSGGGHFFDLASHQLDYLDFLFGPVQRVRSTVKNTAGLYEAEDMVTAEIEFGGNITGTGIWCFNAPAGHSRDVIEFTGDRGAIRFSTFGFENIVVTTAGGTEEYVNERPEHVQYCLIDQIVRALEGNGGMQGNGQAAARTSRVMDEIVSRYYNRQPAVCSEWHSV